MRLASQSIIEKRFAREIKNGIRDKSVSKGVRILQVISTIVGIILLVMGCTVYFLL